MENFRKMAAKMEQRMLQLAAQGISDVPVIMDRMMDYIPELHQIWEGATDDQLINLCNELPSFHRYALIMENAFEQERNTASRPYDGMLEVSDTHKKTMTAILTASATLEHGYLQILMR
jgi:hypothetical protein